MTAANLADQHAHNLAVTALYDAVRRLVDPHTRRVMRDPGHPTTTHQEPSLYDQLRAETGHGTGTGLNKGSKAGVPIAVAVVDLLNDIHNTLDQLTQNWHAGLPEPVSRRVQAHAIANCVAQHWDTETIQAVANILDALVRRGEGILNPLRKLHIAAPCPACGTTAVLRADDTGDLVVAPALVVDAINGCYCQAADCGHHWPVADLARLGEQLGTLPSADEGSQPCT